MLKIEAWKQRKFNTAIYYKPGKLELVISNLFSKLRRVLVLSVKLLKQEHKRRHSYSYLRKNQCLKKLSEFKLNAD